MADLELGNVFVMPPAFGHDKTLLFLESHVFLHPSRFEEMAKLPREAMATGLPVIASKESNLGDWAVSHGFGLSTGLDPLDLAAAMQKIIDHPNSLTALSEKCIKFSDEHRWLLVGRQMIDGYRSLIR